jgi:hypothetical protein
MPELRWNGRTGKKVDHAVLLTPLGRTWAVAKAIPQEIARLQAIADRVNEAEDLT